MSEEQRAVWISGADPAIVTPDDVTDLVKIVGDVVSVKLQYNPERQAVLYRVVFRNNAAAEAILQLEGLVFRECTLSFWSSVYGSRPASAMVDSNSSRANDSISKSVVASAQPPPPPAVAVLPFLAECPPESRLDNALIPTFESILSMVNHEEDPQGCPVGSIPTDEWDLIVEQCGGAGNLITIVRGFVESCNATGRLHQELRELERCKSEKDKELMTLLQRPVSSPAAYGLSVTVDPSSSSKSITTSSPFESKQEADAATARRVRNRNPLSLDVAHPIELLRLLTRRCGPVVRHYISYPAYGGSSGGFHLTVEFISEHCAKKALTAFNAKSLGLMKVPGKKGPSSIHDDDAQLASYGFAGWEPCSIQLQRPSASQLPDQISDNEWEQWTSLLLGS